MRVRIERAYRSRPAELINDVTRIRAHMHVRERRNTRQNTRSVVVRETGRAAEEGGIRSGERRNKNTFGEVTG